MKIVHLSVVLLAYLCVKVFGIFNPIMRVSGCTKKRLTLLLQNASDEGIVYVLGASSACRQFTSSPVSRHVITFDDCGITWRDSFKIVIQRKAEYQTGEDKQIPVNCILDTRDLHVGSKIDVIDKVDDPGINKTVSPTASMSLYSSGANVGGKQVRLTDQITMVIQLNEEYDVDFDIQAKNCHADNIQIIKNGCPADAELFPKFTTIKQGMLQAVFGAFRTTRLDAGVVRMSFSCTLNVSLGPHPPVACEEMDERRKRSRSPSKLLENVTVTEAVYVCIDNYTANYNIPVPVTDCVNHGLFVGVIILLMALLCVTAFANIYTCVQLRSEKRHRKVTRDILYNHLYEETRQYSKRK